MHLFEQFVGGWALDVTYLPADGPPQRMTGEWHFEPILAGRAVQDVLILGDVQAGTTVRMPVPGSDSWQVCWAGVTGGNFCTLVARPDGAGVRLDGRNHLHDELLVWRFSDITPTSFRWTGEVSLDGGASWRLEQEMTALRIG